MTQYGTVGMLPSHSGASKMGAATAARSYALGRFDRFHDDGYGYDSSHIGTCGACPSCGVVGGCGCVRGVSSGCDYGDTCHFPQPPPRRCYCYPAAFSSRCGERQHRLLVAYGSSRPC